MNKARLDWVMSGLKQHALATAEDLFLKTASADFDKNQALTERQEERLENLYKEKSQSIPDKDHFAFNESSPNRVRPRRPTGKYY